MRDYFTLQSSLHVGIIMDGNGRWAAARGLPRLAGHEAGAEAVNRVVEAAPGCGVAVLTLFAFSSDNWSRPKEEVAALMRLFACYLEREAGRCVENGIRLEVIGRRDRLSRKLLAAIGKAECATAGGSALRLRIAVDYSARDSILTAARGLPQLSRESLETRLGPPVDLLIRRERDSAGSHRPARPLEPQTAGGHRKAERATAGGSALRLRIAVDYSARDSILAAARGLPQLSRESLETRLGPPVDLLIPPAASSG